MSVLKHGSRLAFAILLLAPASGAAQHIPSSYRFVEEGQEGGIFTGWLSMSRGQFDLGPGPGPVFGGRYAIRLGGPISAEGVMTLMPTTRDVIDPSRDEGQRKIDQAAVLLASIHANLKFSLVGQRTWKEIAPYITVGAGLVFDPGGEQPEDKQLAVDDRFDFGSSFMGTLGAGARWVPGRRLALRGDVELRMWQLDTPRGFLLVDRFPDAPQSDWVSGLSFTVGASYLF